MENNKKGLFISDFGRRKYFRAYEKCLGFWPPGYECRSVQTPWGKTAVYSLGDGKAPDLVVFHAMGVSAPSWYPNVGALAEEFRVHVVSYPGDAGLSDFHRSPAHRQEAADWFEALCKGLGIGPVHVAGASFGAFLAANAAVYKPEFVKKVVLISPGGVFEPVGLGFYLRIMMLLLLPSRFITRWVVKWLHAPGADLNNPLAELFGVSVRYSRPEVRFAPSSFSDEELSSIKSRVLLLLGRYEALVKPWKVVKRARLSIRSLVVKVFDRAGHLLPFEQADMVNRAMLAFLLEE